MMYVIGYLIAMIITYRYTRKLVKTYQGYWEWYDVRFHLFFSVFTVVSAIMFYFEFEESDSKPPKWL